MSNTPDNPIEVFANMFKGGQDVYGDAPHADPMAGFVALTRQMTEAQQQFMKQMTDYWSGKPSAAAVAGKAGTGDDKRFSADAWRNDPRFDLVRRTYLAYS